MAERVNTGGLREVVYPKGYEPKLGEQQKNEIREAYERADERKRRERRNRIIFWIIGAIVLVGILGFVIFRSL